MSSYFPSETGLYGQLGHGSRCSSDEPKIVEFFSDGRMSVEDVICGLWNTFVLAVSRDQVAPWPKLILLYLLPKDLSPLLSTQQRRNKGNVQAFIKYTNTCPNKQLIRVNKS